MVRCLYLQCSGNFPGQEHDENNCKGYCCNYCKSKHLGKEVGKRKRKHFRGHCTGDDASKQFPSAAASSAVESRCNDDRLSSESSCGESPASFQDSSDDDTTSAKVGAVEIAPPAAMVEVEADRIQETRIGLLARIREQPEFTPTALRLSGPWA